MSSDLKLPKARCGTSTPARIGVIGSGLGGLAAALDLARRGHQVEVFEQDRQPGGCAVHFSRKGFTFDPALHAIPAGAPGQPFHSLLASLGLADQVEFIPLAQGAGVRIGQREYRLPATARQVWDYLVLCFPKEVRGIARLRRCLSRACRSYLPVLTGTPKAADWLRFIPGLPVFLARSFESTDRFLGRYVQDPELKVLLYSYSVFMGLPMDRFPAVNWLVMTGLLLETGTYTIAGGGGTLTKTMACALETQGGRIHLRCAIRSVVHDGRRVLSLVDQQGQIHGVDAVMANLNTPALLELLEAGGPLGGASGQGGQNPAWRKQRNLVAGRSLSLSVVTLHLGLDCPVADLGIQRHLQFVFPSADLNQDIRRQQASLFPLGYSLTAPGISDPATLEGNDRVLSMVGGVDGQAWLALDAEAYDRTKEECIRQMGLALEALYPGIGSHIQVQDLATPRTFQRYTGNPRGAIMGWECSPGSHRELQALSRPPLENLFLASAWTDRLGGFMQAMAAGVAAAAGFARWWGRGHRP